MTNRGGSVEDTGSRVRLGDRTVDARTLIGQAPVFRLRIEQLHSGILARLAHAEATASAAESKALADRRRTEAKEQARALAAQQRAAAQQRHIQALVAAAPPLTTDQRARLAVLLAPAVRHDPSPPPPHPARPSLPRLRDVMKTRLW